MFEGEDRRAFAEAFYNMLCEEESHAGVSFPTG